MAFYAVLARHGFFPEAELERFMSWDGILGGHPDRLRVPGVEVSTGSLGHGLPLAVGVAYGLRAKGLDEQRVFVLVGDAELNEGANWEAILHAGSRRAREPDAGRRRQRERQPRARLARGQAASVRLGGRRRSAAATTRRSSGRSRRRGVAPTAVVAELREAA